MLQFLNLQNSKIRIDIGIIGELSISEKYDMLAHCALLRSSERTDKQIYLDS